MPSVLSERSADLLLIVQPDHQAKRLLYHALCVSAAEGFQSLLHQHVIDLDVDAHGKRSVGLLNTTNISRQNARAYGFRVRAERRAPE
jgi:hypothetical protein